MTAAGWPSVTWSNILAATDPLPSPSVVILARHLTACRSRMNEALATLGASLLTWSQADPTGQPIQAIDINEVLQRAQGAP